MRFGDYGAYLVRRWDALGGEEATQAVREQTGVYEESQMPWNDDPQRAEALADAFKRAQCPIFVTIVGELHHLHGHTDVGLGYKPAGNHWETRNGPVASDIIVLKSLDGDGSFQWVDAFSSMGGPEARPQWAVIPDNPDRTWLKPPTPDGTSDTGDGDGDTGDGSTDSDLTALQEEVAALRRDLEALTAAAIKRGDGIALRADGGQLLSAEGGGPTQPYEVFVIGSRLSQGAWETFRVE